MMYAISAIIITSAARVHGQVFAPAQTNSSGRHQHHQHAFLQREGHVDDQERD